MLLIKISRWSCVVEVQKNTGPWPHWVKLREYRGRIGQNKNKIILLIENSFDWTDLGKVQKDTEPIWRRPKIGNPP